MRASPDWLKNHKNSKKLLGEEPWDKSKAPAAPLPVPASLVSIGSLNPAVRAVYNKFHVAARADRTCDGICFDSKREMQAYQWLVRMKIPFVRQAPFLLQEAFKCEGVAHRAIVYEADFLLGTTTPRTDPQAPLQPGELVLDIKGMHTDVYKLKRKLFAKRYARNIVEVRKLKDLPAIAGRFVMGSA